MKNELLVDSEFGPNSNFAGKGVTSVFIAPDKTMSHEEAGTKYTWTSMATLGSESIWNSNVDIVELVSGSERSYSTMLDFALIKDILRQQRVDTELPVAITASRGIASPDNDSV